MNKGNKTGMGIGIVGFSFVVLGLIFLGVGKAPIGIPILAVGLFLIVAGLAAARKAPPPNASSGTQPPSEGGSDGA